MRRTTNWMVVAAALCAAAPVQGQVTDRALAVAEQGRDKAPNSAEAQRRVGIAYYKAARYDDARTALSRATSLDPRDGLAALYLGLTAEAVNDLGAARRAYTSYLATGKTRKTRTLVQDRLAAVERLELQAAAKAAVAREQELGNTVGPKTTIAVMPLRFVGADTTLRPLERGMVDLMVTDFAKVKALTVLERERVQVLMDEIKLSESGRVEAASAVRSGRLLTAGSVVQGAITQTGSDRLQVAASVVSVATSEATGTANAENSLERLFDLEKEIVLGVIERLGITLSPAEREAIQQRPTRSVQAFLAYSRGLVASDAGRLDEARNFFDNARALDPGFGAAAAAAQSARSTQVGATVTTPTIEASLAGGSEGKTVEAATTGAVVINSDLLGSTLQQALADVNPSGADLIGVQTGTSTRDASTQTTGVDQPSTRAGTVTIIIRRPGGL